MTFDNEKWSQPHRVSFNDSTADDYYPSFSPDGKYLYFSSRRKLPDGYTQAGDMRIWRVMRDGGNWGTPVPIDTTVSRGFEFAHSITNDGTLFFSAGFFDQQLNGKTGWSIYKSSDVNSSSPITSRMPYSINSMGYEDGPYVAPDESFLIFESERPEGMGNTDLYITFKTGDQWTRPLNMGPKINSSYSERFARLSPDGKYLFFGSSRDEKEGHPGFDIYWIDASIISDLQQSSDNKYIDNALGEELLMALDDGKWDQAGLLLKEWLSRHPIDADATFNFSVALKNQLKFEEAQQHLQANEQMFTGNPTYDLEMALLNIALGRNEIADTLLAPLLSDPNQKWNRYMWLSNSLMDIGKYDLSDEYFKNAMSVNMWSFGYFKRACAYASMGEYERAFESLSHAINNGFHDKQSFESNASLAPLRSQSGWRHIAAKLK
jgi:hypothetical protein